jgi:hypothetical protein
MFWKNVKNHNVLWNLKLSKTNIMCTKDLQNQPNTPLGWLTFECNNCDGIRTWKSIIDVLKIDSWATWYTLTHCTMEFNNILCNKASRHGEYNEKKMEFQRKQVTYHCMRQFCVVRKDKKLARNSCTQFANSTSDKGNPLIMNGLLWQWKCGHWTKLTIFTVMMWWHLFRV